MHTCLLKREAGSSSQAISEWSLMSTSDVKLRQTGSLSPQVEGEYSTATIEVRGGST